MSEACNRYLNCNLRDLSFGELMAALIVKNETTGCYYLNLIATSGDCDDVVPASVCGNNESWEELFRKTIVLDECGRPAIQMFVGTDRNE
jgi:hypothetical protein